MPRITKEIDANDAGLMWIHVHEPSALKDLAVKLAMHELCAAGFSDLRAFSSFIPVNNGLFVSFCNFFLSGTKIKMYKIFVYIGKNVAVTYERS